MKKLLLIIITCIFCYSCGVKDDPKYEAQNNYNEKIKVI